jgi:peroxiredoxin
MKLKSYLVLLIVLILSCSVLTGCKTNNIKQKKTELSFDVDYSKDAKLISKDAGNWKLPVVFFNNSEYNNIDHVELNIELKENINNPKIKVILITFWVTWGPEFFNELVLYDRMYQKYKDKGLIVFAISIDTNLKLKDNIIKDVRKLGLTYPVLWDLDNKVKQSYNINSIPVTFLIDKNDKIRHEHSGFTLEDVENTEKAIITLLKE